MPSASRSYGRLADKIRVDSEVFKIFYTLKYLDFYFVNITAILFIVLEVHFGQIKHILGHVLWCVKLGCNFFHVVAYLCTRVPNDSQEVQLPVQILQ